MADDKAENFAWCLLRDVIGSYCAAMRLKIEIPPEVEKDRCVPKYFYTEIIEFSKPFIDELIADIVVLPVLLYSSNDFFKRFTYSVCLELAKGEEDEQISFLKVTAFLLMISATLFINVCYRPLEDIPDIYHRMLKDHLSTQFYVDGEFEEIKWRCIEIQEDEDWISDAIDEMRQCILDTYDGELDANPDSFEEETCKLAILDVRNQPNQSDSDSFKCKFCGIDCFAFPKKFFQPRVEV